MTTISDAEAMEDRVRLALSQPDFLGEILIAEVADDLDDEMGHYEAGRATVKDTVQALVTLYARAAVLLSDKGLRLDETQHRVVLNLRREMLGNAMRLLGETP